jgi:tRNA modification GTPase
MARERHLSALREAKARLTMAAAPNGGVEIFAEELRLAQNALSSITGEFTSDDLLGEIFSRFCIGK